MFFSDRMTTDIIIITITIKNNSEDKQYLWVKITFHFFINLIKFCGLFKVGYGRFCFRIDSCLQICFTEAEFLVLPGSFLVSKGILAYYRIKQQQN